MVNKHVTWDKVLSRRTFQSDTGQTAWSFLSSLVSLINQFCSFYSPRNHKNLENRTICIFTQVNSLLGCLGPAPVMCQILLIPLSSSILPFLYFISLVLCVLQHLVLWNCAEIEMKDKGINCAVQDNTFICVVTKACKALTQRNWVGWKFEYFCHFSNPDDTQWFGK